MLRTVLRLSLLYACSCLFALTHNDVTVLGTSNDCTTILPSLMIPIFSSAPGMIAQSSTTFLVEQEPTNGYFCDCLISFMMPAVLGSCQLELHFPQGCQNGACGASQMFVWQVDAMLDPNCCWDDAPGADELIGTVLLNRNIPSEIVGSFVCQSSVSFRVGMRAGDAASCSFEQTSSEGFVLSYGCGAGLSTSGGRKWE